jgi:Ras-related GTP-binding protein A/B
MELAEFTAVLDEMTKNTYVLVVVHDPVIGQLVATKRLV